MEIIAPITKSGDYALAPAGMLLAICYSVVYIGTQQDEYMGEPKITKKIRLTFELHGDVMMDDGRPFSISKEYTFSSHEKSALRKDIEAWRGLKYSDDELEKMGGLPITKILGKPCLLNVGHVLSGKGKEYAKIMSITPTMKGMVIPPTVNELVAYSVDNHNQAVFDKLPEFVREKIKASAEWQEKHNPPAPAPSDAYSLDDTFADDFM